MSADREADRTAKAAVEGTHAGSGCGKSAAASSRADLPDADAGLFGGAIQAVAPRAPGRPEGSQNVRTNKTWQIAVNRYGDPLITSVALGQMNTLDLIRELRKIASDAGIKLGMTVGDVLAFQRACRVDALPYGHAKRVAVTENGEDALPMIVMGHYRPTANVQVNAPGVSLEEALAARTNTQMDQSLSQIDGRVSHDGKSHDDATD
ncbi:MULTISPECIES: hypothetical protein [Rhodopseudomonas]|uniref:Uncharacterized protein n=1 Tax=Rhodopseudomonas palustris TaxID=1076 RepID=A0A0D7F3M0_RHOPL|nr:MULTISPECIES: hypothetical protein [Rhodopseudomonas]KIZ47385.1 hypothetical protein OO17_04565 [Rhodopseudomonas palustris]MDF3809271.1 hypothetical protein [Rhodopseudomonas sp. BAL398]WOK19045.1 hypothetical protein RBJ75_05870 [Rhodopseudomonas sp. BAL398]